MKRSFGRNAFRLVSTLLAAMAVAGAASGDPPAAPAPSIGASVKASFERFAEEWMQKIRQRAALQRQSPTLTPGVAEPVALYRDSEGEFSVELRPTGRPAAPYVGILRYTEQLFRCSGLDGERCSVASSTPVTEIFRYQDGDWVY